MKKQLNFSNDFFDAYLIEDEKDFKIKNYGILINLSKTPIVIDFVSSIPIHKSYLLKDTKVDSVEKAVLLSFAFDPMEKQEKLNEFCWDNWDTNKIRYPDDPTKWKYQIRRSPIEKIGNLELVCWYLPGGKEVTIHNEHPFFEVHTQLSGVGILNKFTEQDPKTLYQRMYMPPGFTHDYFCDNNWKYVWHQYQAVTDSIWMAVIEHK
ncbi:hypothetical protein JW978_04500 [Candidatus Dojkabacteria bacterium]|nr:hypothetical protein [Candidatus Dojkabacteria bacterium]